MVVSHTTGLDSFLTLQSELILRVSWAIFSMTLITVVITGCQTSPPVRNVDSENLKTSPVNLLSKNHLENPDSEPTGIIEPEEITLTSHQSIETVPASVIENNEVIQNGQTVLTLADLQRIAFDNNPTLVAATARMEASGGKRLQAGLYPNPVIGYHATEVGNLNTAGQQGGFVSQKFIMGGKLELDQAMAGKEIDEAHFQFLAQEQRVLSDVRIRFYDALIIQRRVKLTKKLTQVSDEVVESSNKLLAGRQISDNDLLQAEIEAEQVHILFDNSQNENAEAWRRLTSVLGLSTMESMDLDGEIDADIQRYNWDDCLSLVLDKNHELNAAQARVDRARLSISRAHKEIVPDIDLSVSVRHHNVSGSDVANVQAGIPIPILDRNQGNIMRSQSELIGAIHEVKRIELDLQDRLAVTYRSYTNAIQQADRYKTRILPRARKSLEIVTNGYKKGQVDYLTLLTSQRTFIRVNLAYLVAIRELRETSAKIEGQLLSDSLSKRP